MRWSVSLGCLWSPPDHRLPFRFLKSCFFVLFDSLLKSNQIYFRLVRRLVLRLVRRLVTRFLYFRPPLLRSGAFLGFGPIYTHRYHRI